MPIALSQFLAFVERIKGTPKFHRSVREKKNQRTGYHKSRTIYEPNDAMREVHDGLMQMLRSQYGFPRWVSDSVLDAVTPHRGNKYFYQTDIWNAFGSVKVERMIEALCKMNKQWNTPERKKLWHEILAKYCMPPFESKFNWSWLVEDECADGLAQGSPSSPDLFKIYAAYLLDPWLKDDAKRYGLTYTRYMDDITFSSRRRGYKTVPDAIGWRKRNSIRGNIEEAGFKVNFKKTTLHNIDKLPVLINGLWLDVLGRISIPRRYLRRLKGMLYMAAQGHRVDWDVINGLMSVFWSPYGGKVANPQCNKAEQEVLDLYERMKVHQPPRMRKPKQLHLF